MITKSKCKKKEWHQAFHASEHELQQTRGMFKDKVTKKNSETREVAYTCRYFIPASEHLAGPYIYNA